MLASKTSLAVRQAFGNCDQLRQATPVYAKSSSKILKVSCASKGEHKSPIGVANRPPYGIPMVLPKTAAAIKKDKKAAEKKEKEAEKKKEEKEKDGGVSAEKKEEAKKAEKKAKKAAKKEEQAKKPKAKIGASEKGALTGTLIQRLSKSDHMVQELATRLAESEKAVSKLQEERKEAEEKLKGLKDLSNYALNTPTEYNAMIQEVIAARAYFISIETGDDDKVKNWHQAVMDLANGVISLPDEFKIDTSLKPGTEAPEPFSDNRLSDPETVLSVILGGGAGTRLMPLTAKRSKPAVPIGGAYRLIDVPMSNCINSGIEKIYVLTQFNSRTLNRHLHMTYDLTTAPGSTGFVETLSAYQSKEGKKMKGKGWFQGTADAVRKFSWMLSDRRAGGIDDVLILAGDHLYRMDYMEFVGEHRSKKADITVACLPMDEERASDFGLMKFDDTGRITAFIEKPKGAKLKAFKMDSSKLAAQKEGAAAASVEQDEDKPYMASMGIYVFKKNVLLNLLTKEMPDAEDFGSEILPDALEDYHIQAFLFEDYWEDIGTIKSFYKANLALAKKDPKFDFYGKNHKGKPNPIYTRSRTISPSHVMGGTFTESSLSKGCFIEEGCTIKGSVVGIRTHLENNVTLDRVLMLGSDHYEELELRSEISSEGKVPLGVGEGTIVKKAIIDKNARIGKNCNLTNVKGIKKLKNPKKGYYIDDGLIVIMNGAIIPDGTVI